VSLLLNFVARAERREVGGLAARELPRRIVLLPSKSGLFKNVNDNRVRCQSNEEQRQEKHTDGVYLGR